MEAFAAYRAHQLQAPRALIIDPAHPGLLLGGAGEGVEGGGGRGVLGARRLLDDLHLVSSTVGIYTYMYIYT